MEKGGQVELYISGRRPQNGWMKPKPTKSPRENAEPSTNDGPGETKAVFRLPLYSALPRCRKAKGMEETCYAAPEHRERRDKKHPPEDGSELHTSPELSEVLEAHAVHLLEAAEQGLAVVLQACRRPHVCKANKPRVGQLPAVAEETRLRAPPPTT